MCLPSSYRFNQCNNNNNNTNNRNTNSSSNNPPPKPFHSQYPSNSSRNNLRPNKTST